MIEKIIEFKKQREIIIIAVALILLIIFGIYATRLHLAASKDAAANAVEVKSLRIKEEGPLVQVQVAQLGISFTVPKSLGDLQDVIRSLPKRDGKASQAAFFSTTSLTKLDAGCSDTSGAIGVLVKVPGSYPTTAKNAVANYGILIKQFDGFYIAGAYSSKGCATNTSDGSNQIAKSDITTFLNAVSASIQQTK